jgi:hypothetical protein
MNSIIMPRIFMHSVLMHNFKILSVIRLIISVQVSISYVSIVMLKVFMHSIFIYTFTMLSGIMVAVIANQNDL